jgi:protein O-GlcNAc transferase
MLTIYRFFSLQSLNKTSFEVFLLRFPSHVDDLTFRVIEQVEHHIELSTILVQAQQQVARLKLDVLIFTEIGMDFNSYFMAFSRLALRTAMFWGHAITSGINTVDYFISSKHFQELEETRTKYSECVYRMNSLTTSFPRPIQRLNNAIPLTREALGLPSKSISADIMFLVPQTLYKLHPDFDFFIEKILQQVPSGFIVFPQGSLPLLKDQIKSRMASSLSASVYERVYFVRHLNHYEFLQLCEIADLVLDPFPVGGGRSSFEIFSVATPIVMLYSRTTILQLTYGMYQAMGDEELMKSCVAFFEEEYINKAVLLAKDASKRLNMVEKIRYNNHKLYDNSQVVREWETFLYNIMEWKAPIIHNFKGGVNRIKHCPPEMDNLEENIIFQMSFFVDSRQENVPLVLRRKEDPWKVSKQFATSFVPALDFLQANYIYKILYNAQNRLDQPVVGTWTFSVPNRRSSSLTVSIHYGDDIDAVCHSIFHSKDENDAEMIQQATNVIKQQLPQHTTSEWIAARSFIPVLTNNKQKDPDQVETCVTLVMTTCKRLDLFRRTVESLKGVLGSRWGQVLCHVLVIDDNSSHEDRLIMRQLYPEFEFLMKRPDQKGHAKSLNMALDKIESSFMLYVEDDWEFLPQVHSDFIDQSLKILQFQSDPHEHLVQVLLNDQNGGWSRNLLQQHNTIHYKLHEFATVDPTHTFSYWPGFSLNPGVWDVVALKRLGINFSEEMELFERRFALDLWEKGLHVAYLPFQSAVHIGAPPGTNGSAYVLNGLPRNSIDVVTI